MDNENIMKKQETIHSKGFNMGNTQFGKMKVGVKTLDDAILNLGAINKHNQININKTAIYRAIGDNDLPTMRNISNYFYKTSGIYQRICNYFSTMYRYDWYVVPDIYDDSKINQEKVLKDFHKLLCYLDNSYIKKSCGDIALSVIKNGAYYGYIIDNNEGVYLQELPASYCRCRYTIGSKPAIEFNMKFFDKAFSDVAYRLRVLKMFPEEFSRGYILYKQNKLKPDFIGDNDGAWYLLDPEKTVKFSFDNGDIPLFINSIPAILDLDAAQDLDRRKQMQKLLKIVIQKLPMDKNGELIFDIDEARDIHNNAVEMLRRAIGVDVLTTFADIDSIDMSDKNTSTSIDDLEKVERSVFNSLGTSQNLFNATGNISLANSILNDEGVVRTLLLQLATFFDRIAQLKSPNKKKYNFRFYMLETTQYNYKELSKTYKEQVQLGYSKMLPQIALGHSQSSILNTAYFENQVLHLTEIMIPPLMSSTMSMEDLNASKQNGDGEEGKTGRPELPEEQKSDKTILNKESMS